MDAPAAVTLGDGGRPQDIAVHGLSVEHIGLLGHQDGCADRHIEQREEIDGLGAGVHDFLTVHYRGGGELVGGLAGPALGPRYLGHGERRVVSAGTVGERVANLCVVSLCVRCRLVEPDVHVELVVRVDLIEHHAELSLLVEDRVGSLVYIISLRVRHGGVHLEGVGLLLEGEVICVVAEAPVGCSRHGKHIVQLGIADPCIGVAVEEDVHSCGQVDNSPGDVGVGGLPNSVDRAVAHDALAGVVYLIVVSASHPPLDEHLVVLVESEGVGSEVLAGGPGYRLLGVSLHVVLHLVAGSLDSSLEGIDLDGLRVGTAEHTVHMAGLF